MTRPSRPHVPSGSESYYSDAALAKQAEADRLTALGERLPIGLMAGFLEPRVHATDAERCVCCGLDARETEGGEEHHGQRWCYICVGRDHHEDGPFVAAQPARTQQPDQSGGAA